MNERIQELAEQAFDKANNGTISDIKIPKEFIEKFAELIVRECISIVEKNESEMHCDNGMYPVYPTVCEIKKHFGVEE